MLDMTTVGYLELTLVVACFLFVFWLFGRAGAWAAILAVAIIAGAGFYSALQGYFQFSVGTFGALAGIVIPMFLFAFLMGHFPIWTAKRNRQI